MAPAHTAAPACLDIADTITNDLATSPEVHAHLIDILNNPSTSIWDVEHVVRRDPALTMNVLRLASSLPGGLRPPAATVAQAIRSIGYAALKQRLCTLSVFPLFQSHQPAPLSYKAYSAHCLGTAVAARQIALRMGVEQPEEFFVAGLLHDIGKLVHNQYCPEQFRAALTLAAAERWTIQAAEQEVFGFTHAHTGGHLAASWQLSSTIQRVVAYHHTPQDSHHRPPTLQEHVVHCANIISHSLGLGESGNHRMPPLVARSWEILHLAPNHLAEISARTKREFSYLIDGIFGYNGSDSSQSHTASA